MPRTLVFPGGHRVTTDSYLMEQSRRFNQELDDFVPPRNCTPTTAKPGSPEKVAILAERFLMGEELHHERDLQHEVPGQSAEVAAIERFLAVVNAPARRRKFKVTPEHHKAS